jgi:hypothetical protein
LCGADQIAPPYGGLALRVFNSDALTEIYNSASRNAKFLKDCFVGVWENGQDKVIAAGTEDAEARQEIQFDKKALSKIPIKNDRQFRTVVGVLPVVQGAKRKRFKVFCR